MHSTYKGTVFYLITAISVCFFVLFLEIEKIFEDEAKKVGKKFGGKRKR